MRKFRVVPSEFGRMKPFYEHHRGSIELHQTRVGHAGKPERHERALKMVKQMQMEAFGHCTNIGECEAVCPKEIKIEVIARMNRDYLKGVWTERPDSGNSGGNG